MFLKGTKIIHARHMAFWRANSIPALSSRNGDEWMYNMSPQCSLTHIKCLQPASGKCWIVADSWWVSLMRSWSVGGARFNHWKAKPAFQEGGESHTQCDGRGRKAHYPKPSARIQVPQSCKPPPPPPATENRITSLPPPGFVQGLPINFQIKSTSLGVI